MDWVQRMNEAIGYIEGHITEEIDYAEAAQIACCSVYHFQRMFPFITDVTLSEYIRRRSHVHSRTCMAQRRLPHARPAPN
ncbi:hypothetical protein AB4124_02775 [Paenibacillus sp. 2KB_20]|uniref:hypothetical protein n=1 Tax=Paenibacillus sp. 2KB_20 TaxID=3232977 RepID=UPI003F9DBE11